MWKLNAQELGAIVDKFEEIEKRRDALGGYGDPRDTARAADLERRLMGLLGMETSDQQRRRYPRLSCNFWVEVRSAQSRVSGTITDIGAGGLFVAANLPVAVGDLVELEIERQPWASAAGLVAAGVVAWTGGQRRPQSGFGVSFAPRDEAMRTGASRFVLEILRKRVASRE